MDELQRKMSAGQQVIAELSGPVPDLREAWEHMAEVEHFDIAAAEGNFHRCSLTPAPAWTCGRKSSSWPRRAAGSSAS